MKEREIEIKKKNSILWIIPSEMEQIEREGNDGGAEGEIMENRKDIYNLWIQYTTKVNSIS